MICETCSKLAVIYNNLKKCKQCGLPTNISIASLCENCSIKNNKCSICIKNVNNSKYNSLKFKNYKGCNSCGK